MPITLSELEYSRSRLFREYGEDEITRFLNERDTPDKVHLLNKAFHNACGDNDTRLLKLMLALKHINIEVKTEMSDTPLARAVADNAEASVDLLLLTAKARSISIINTKCSGGATVIMFAAMRGHTKIVNRLLEETDIDLTLTDDNNKTVLERQPSKNAEANKDITVLINTAKENALKKLSIMQLSRLKEEAEYWQKQAEGLKRQVIFLTSELYKQNPHFLFSNSAETDKNETKNQEQELAPAVTGNQKQEKSGQGLIKGFF